MKQTHTVSLKLIIFTVVNGSLKVYLPPQTELHQGNSLDHEVEVLIATSTGLSIEDGFIEQLYTISNPVTVVYYMLVADNMIPEKAKKNWVSIADTKQKGPNGSILQYGVQRLQWKIEYTNIVYSLLPNEFTLGELQHVYEAILNRPLDKRNFRKNSFSRYAKRFFSKKTLGRARPAEVYSFKDRKPHNRRDPLISP